MPDLAELERRWLATPVATAGTIHRLVVRTGAGAHAEPAEVIVSPVAGIVGDRWAAAEAPHPEAQVSLIERRVVELLAGDAARWHTPGDNLVVDLDLSIAALPVGARLVAGAAVLEITGKPHAGCAKFRARLGDDALAWVNADERRPRRLRGVYAKVVTGGTLRVGDRLARAD